VNIIEDYDAIAKRLGETRSPTARALRKSAIWPELMVPLATYTGWVWANDGCEVSGQYIPFQATKAQRIAAGDPRPSVQERYPSFAMYRAAVMNAIDKS
jgi:hypothetical protein